MGCWSRHSAQVHPGSAAQRPHSQDFGQCRTRAALERSASLGKKHRLCFQTVSPRGRYSCETWVCFSWWEPQDGHSYNCSSQRGEKRSKSQLKSGTWSTARGAPEAGQGPASAVVLLGPSSDAQLCCSPPWPPSQVVAQTGLTVHPALAALSSHERSLLMGKKQERLQGGLQYSHGSRLTETSSKDGKTKQVDKSRIPKSFYNR